MIGGVVYIVANLVVFVMLVCMLASAFVESDARFRFAAGVLAASSIGCFFFALGELTVQADGVPLELGAVQWVQVAQSLALAIVLVMMRLRQRAAGVHTHPRERRSSLRQASLEELERRSVHRYKGG